MIPTTDVLLTTDEEQQFKNKTYKITFLDGKGLTNGTQIRREVSVKPKEEYRIDGYIDGLDSVAQAAFLILSTERFEYIIYSWDYGIEMVDLYGKDMPYVMSELPRRIKESLMTDNRITDVSDFEFEQNGHKLATTFTITTNVGEILGNVEVAI